MYRIITLFLVIFLLPYAALAAVVDVAQSVTLTLPSDSSTYTLNIGSLTELTVNNSSFTFKISGGDSVELIASGKQKLSNDMSPQATSECNANDSRVILSIDSGKAAQTVIVTPGATCTAASTSSGGGSPSLGATFSGGGGGGGGGGVSAPPPAPAPAPAPVAPAPTAAETIAEKIAQIQTKIAELRGAPAPKVAITGVQFGVNLKLGDSGDDVKRLQEFLKTDPSLYPKGLVSGYYGSLTQSAVQRFQEKYGIASPGVPGYGNMGPKTREKLNQLLSEKAAVAPPSVPTPAPAPSSETPSKIDEISAKIKEIQKKILDAQSGVAPSPAPVSAPAAIGEVSLTRGLSIGSSGDDVRALQEFLASDPALYPEANVSGYYGSLTRAAVQRFQEKYGIAFPGVPGYGNVGPKTREKIKDLTSGGMPSPVPAPTPAPAPSSEAPSKVDEISAKIKEIQQKILNLQSKPAASEPVSPPLPPPSSDTQSSIDAISAKIKEIQQKILDLQNK